MKNEYRLLGKKDKDVKKFFLDFPSQLYDEDCPQDYITEKQILCGEHILSPDVIIFPYVVLNERDRVVCRCLMTYHKGTNVAYVGYFEAREDIVAVKKMFAELRSQAVRDGKTELVGPIDVSIYIGYRFKVDRFDKVYTGEPYNKPYYPQMWKDCGFTVSDKYLSNQLRIVTEDDIDVRLERVYQRCKERGYDFITSNKKDFEKHLNDVYQLLTESYSGFVGYHPLTQEQFVKMFLPLRYVVNFDMVRLAYRNDKLCAFCIAMPNYGTLTRGHMSVIKLIETRDIRRNPKEYVILYAGGDKRHAGIGSALIQDVRNALLKNGCTSIGALIKEGNMTGELYKDLYTDVFHYELYKKSI